MSRRSKPVALLLLLALLVVPVIGQSRSFAHAMFAGGRRLPAAEYSMLGRLQNDYPQDTIVATLDWSMIQLIGMFTDLDSAVSDIQHTARTPAAEMDRLIAIYRAFGLSRDDFLSDVRGSTVDDNKRVAVVSGSTLDAAPYWRGTFVSDAEFRRASIAHYVLRFQNLQRFAGVQILAAPDAISDGLLDYLGGRWDAAPPCADWIAKEVRLVLIDERTPPAAHWSCGPTSHAYSQGHLVLYRLDKWRP